ncbi:thioredoxin family protein [Nonomuraea angiospora]|uniref:Thiol-disulfide isomerase/thioredoxin n=1 Tax=Nonomuraea angiospora TaxID=46172 RepID=A0ABR9MAE7_9ACTN|nr:thioredoxin family protein [Nonomuraea angiospora]MBE1589769.1 thiol-disulfide isomerase/thioredoxin [Nonomuraea angiospora]
MTGWWVALATLALGSVIGVVRLRRDGRVRDTGGDRLSEADLGAGLGERATLVQFSTAFCQPCRATRRILSDVSGIVPGVTHVEIDAESRLDLVRRLDIMRTPTVLVLDTSGRIVKRAAGLPRKADVLAALAAAVPPPPSHESSHQPDEM